MHISSRYVLTPSNANGEEGRKHAYRHPLHSTRSFVVGVAARGARRLGAWSGDGAGREFTRIIQLKKKRERMNRVYRILSCRKSDGFFSDSTGIAQAQFSPKEFSNKLLSRKPGVARCAIINFKKGKNTIRPRKLRKLIKGIHDLQNRNMKN